MFLKSVLLISNISYKLDLIDESPFFIKPYPLPFNCRTEVLMEITKMLNFNIIRRSSSQYINPVRIVIKKDNSIRLCLDARELNKRLKNDYESPPGLEELFPRCRNAKFLSSLDLTNSFWQIKLHEDSRKFTVFKIDNRVYEFNIVLFGLKTSSAALLRGLTRILFDIDDFLIQFVDDLAIILSTFETHLQRLKILFERAEKNYLGINFKKSNFAQKQIKFLGHYLSYDGLTPDPDKITSIKSFTIPKNVKELQAFFGFINFYTKFVKYYSMTVYPLFELLQKDKKFIWTEVHQKAFDDTKNLFDKNFFYP